MVKVFVFGGGIPSFFHCKNQWEFQDPIHWRYLPYIRPIVQAYVSEYPSKIWPKIWYVYVPLF